MSFDERVKNEYFNWLYNYVCKGRAHQNISYEKLLWQLHNIEFTFSIRNDINRAKDGVDLRYRFSTNQGTNDILSMLDALDGPCSVLEMMVALSIRCEETIMDNTRYGDRTGQWFWGMMSNLGIGMMSDDIFDAKVVEDIIYDFLDRNYDPDGKGSLFYIQNCEEDLRNLEIWTQLCWYLDKFA